MTVSAEPELLDRLAALVVGARTPGQREAALVTLGRVQRAAGFHVETLRRM